MLVELLEHLWGLHSIHGLHKHLQTSVVDEGGGRGRDHEVLTLLYGGVLGREAALAGTLSAQVVAGTVRLALTLVVGARKDRLGHHGGLRHHNVETSRGEGVQLRGEDGREGRRHGSLKARLGGLHSLLGRRGGGRGFVGPLALVGLSAVEGVPVVLNLVGRATRDAGGNGRPAIAKLTLELHNECPLVVSELALLDFRGKVVQPSLTALLGLSGGHVGGNEGPVLSTVGLDELAELDVLLVVPVVTLDAAVGSGHDRMLMDRGTNGNVYVRGERGGKVRGGVV